MYKDVALIFKTGSSIAVSTESDPALYDLTDLVGLELCGGCSVADATLFVTKIVKLVNRPISFEWNEFTVKISNA